MNVKNWSENVPVRVAKTKSFVMENGERACVLIDQLGMPLYYPNLFITTQIRNRSLSASTSLNSAGHLCAFLQALGEIRLDLFDRLSTGRLLEPHEVERLRGELQRCLVAQPSLGFRTYFSQHEYVSKEVMHARVAIATQYIQWLAARYLRNPRDPEELKRIVAALKQIRPVNKKRNTAKRKRGLDRVTAAAVLEVLNPTSQHNIWKDEAVRLRNILVLSLLYELGLRRGELLNLKIEDIDFKVGRIFVMRRADEKDDPRIQQPLVKTNDRELPVTPSLLREMLDYINRCRRNVPNARRHGFLLVTHKAGPTVGQPLSISGYKDIIVSLREAVPTLREFTGHDLRHYWNQRFSELSDKVGLTTAEEELMRSQLMGWNFGSGTAATYNKRHVELKAMEHSLRMQEASLRQVKGLKK